jgi:hypothetical protein
MGPVVTAGVEDVEPAEEDLDDVEDHAAEDARRWRTLRVVAVIGLVLTVALYVRGLRWSAPLVPPVLAGVTGFLVIWLAATAAVELVHRHHHAAAAHGLRLGRAGAMAGARHGGRWWRAAVTRARDRWDDRFPAAGVIETGPAAAAGLLAPAASAAGDHQQTGDDMTTTDDATAPAPAAPQRHGPARGTPAPWRALAAAIAGFEPEDHEEMKAWLSGNVAGAAAVAEAFADVYEHCREVRKLDPKAIKGLEAAQEAAGEFMAALAYARQRYAAEYQPVEEFTETTELPKGAREFFGNG